MHFYPHTPNYTCNERYFLSVCLFLFFKDLLTPHRNLYKVFYLEIVLLTQYVMRLVFLSSRDFILGH